MCSPTQLHVQLDLQYARIRLAPAGCRNAERSGSMLQLRFAITHGEMLHRSIMRLVHV